MPDRGVQVISTLAAPPPYFVHVLVYGAADRADLPFALPTGPPHRLSDALLETSHPAHAILIGDARWSGHTGQLILAPSYPGGGEVGSHLVFSYRSGKIYRGISIHPWPSVYRYRVGRQLRSLRLAPTPAYPEIERTLHKIVDSTQ